MAHFSPGAKEMPNVLDAGKKKKKKKRELHWPAILTLLSMVQESSTVTLSNSQVMLLLVVGGPHFENPSSRVFRCRGSGAKLLDSQLCYFLAVLL